MPSKSKAKGNRFEREVVAIAQANGFESSRAWGSNGKAYGSIEESDVKIGDKEYQLKCRKKIADYLQIPEGLSGVIFKQDRGETLVLITLNDYLCLLKKEHYNG